MYENGFALDDDWLKELLEKICAISALEKEFMGLSSFFDSQLTLKEAKKYLNEKELKAMGQLISGYLNFAERQAEREQVMTMEDWVSI